jgi:Zn-dependent protease
MIKILKNIPVYVHPSFWFLAFLIGYLNSQTLIQMGLWVLVVFISVLVHELGHALTARLWYKNLHIELGPLGGVTVRQGPPVGKLKEFLIVVMGPLFGFLLGAFAYICLRVTNPGVGAMGYLLWITAIANFFWSVLNLLPVHPLDGGKLMSIILEWLFGLRGVRFSYLLSGLFGFAFMTYFFYHGQLFAGLLFLLCAYESFRAFQNERQIGSSSDTQKLADEIEKAEVDWKAHQPERAIQRLEAIVKNETHGEFFYRALETLGEYLLASGQTQKAYSLLSANKRKLSIEMLKQFQLAAFKLGLWQESLQVGTKVFLEDQDISSAVLNAFSSANLQNVEEAIHWLAAIKRINPNEFAYVLASDDLDSIRKDSRFQKFASQ